MKSILFLALFVSSGLAFSANSVVTGNVSRIMNYEGHSGTLISLSSMSSIVGYCDRDDYFILPNGHAFENQDYALLLSAKMADIPVSIIVSSGECLEGFPRLKSMYID